MPASVRLREADDGGESRVVEGYALKFGVRSVLMGYYYPMYEVLEPGCVSEDMLREQRVYFTMFHNRQIVLGRWDKGEGTLRLSVDETGLRVECELPHTPDGDTALELLRRGDLSEMSFIYWTDEEDTENCVSMERTDEKTEWGRDIYLRHVKKVLGMCDVTIAATPAYEDTEIQAREQQVRQFVESIQDDEAPDARQDREAEAKALMERRERLAEARKLRDIASALT